VRRRTAYHARHKHWVRLLAWLCHSMQVQEIVCFALKKCSRHLSRHYRQVVLHDAPGAIPHLLLSDNFHTAQ